MNAAESGFNLQNSHVLIVGLGLMGGSLALALKGKCQSIIGIDTHTETCQMAIEQQIVDEAWQGLDQRAATADVIVLATPVDRILEYLDILPTVLNPQKKYLVFDLGSTKQKIIAKMENLPANIFSVGCHPICGKENLSLRNAERTLYFGAPLLVTRTSRSDSNVMSFLRELADELGLKMAELDASQHDKVLANISHLPYLISTALAMATPDEVAPYVGPGFRSTSRLAGTASSMMMSIIQSNRENILANLEKFSDELAFLTSCIAENDEEGLRTYLDSARENYRRLKG